MDTIVEPWCIVLAGRASAQAHAVPTFERRAARRPMSLVSRDPMSETLRRAATVAPWERIGAVMAESLEGSPPGGPSPGAFDSLLAANRVVEPVHRGTGHEVLLALLHFEARIPAGAPVIFLPADHVVSSEDIMTAALLDMSRWIVREPQPVYLLGAVPEGPHDQLGYVIPWHDTPQLPTSVYEFVEMPDVRLARKLINEGGLWNTFIFGGTVESIRRLFTPAFEPEIDSLREALAAPEITRHETLRQLYENLPAIDFSRHMLVNQVEKLNVLRLARCGWWPLKSPRLDGASVPETRSMTDTQSTTDTHESSDAYAPAHQERRWPEVR